MTLVLDGVEISSGLSADALAARKQVIHEATMRLRDRGWKVEEKRDGRRNFVPGARVAAPAYRKPRKERRQIPRTPEELERMRKLRQERENRRARNRRAEIRAEIQAGLREPVKRVKPSVSKVAWSLPVGVWITYELRGGGERTALVLDRVPAGVTPSLPADAVVRGNGHREASRIPRYLLALPAVDALAHPAVVLPCASEVEKGLIRVHQEPPVLQRLLTPLPVGTPVSWDSQGGGIVNRRNGVVAAYIPAGVPVSSLGIELCQRDGTVDVSIRDRYLVRCDRQRNDRSRAQWSLPPAYLVEEPFLPKQNEKVG